VRADPGYKTCSKCRERVAEAVAPRYLDTLVPSPPLANEEAWLKKMLADQGIWEEEEES
jgi:hypothetical protein